jgi:hypothetical protein
MSLSSISAQIGRGKKRAKPSVRSIRASADVGRAYIGMT